MEEVKGGCLCGAVRIVARGAPDRVGLCHCLDCRKHHGAVFFAVAVFAPDAVTITGETRAWDGRHFCPVCGGSVHAVTGDEVEVHLGTLDEPGVFAPTYEIWADRREPWLPDFDGVTRYPRGRDEGG